MVDHCDICARERAATTHLWNEHRLEWARRRTGNSNKVTDVDVVEACELYCQEIWGTSITSHDRAVVRMAVHAMDLAGLKVVVDDD